MAESSGHVSGAGSQFDRWRRTMGLFFGPVGAVVLLLVPPVGLSPQAQRLSAILLWVVIYWITEALPIPVTALLGIVLCVISGVGSVKDVFAPFANPILFLLLGSFFIATAMSVHRLDWRIALAILSLRGVGESPSRILCALGAVTAFLSMWISNTAATAMMFPIALGVLRSVRGGSQRYSTGVMLMIAFSASVGGIGTLIGSPPNMIGAGFIRTLLGVNITFLRWLSFGLPLMLVMFGVLYLLMKALHPSHQSPNGKAFGEVTGYIVAQRKALGPWTPGERNTAIVFLVAVLLWMAPGILALLFGAASGTVRWYEERVPEGVVAVLASVLLFLFPTDWKRREFTLTWEQAARIDWGTILLFGGGLSLGEMMFKTGLSEAIGRGASDLFSAQTQWGITALAIALAIVVSELTSNTASANMVIPVVISLAQAAGVNPLPPALGACLGASFGFMLPISTPPNAIVYGSGLIPITRMIRAGVFFDLVGFFLIWGGLRLLSPLLGLV